MKIKNLFKSIVLAVSLGVIGLFNAQAQFNSPSPTQALTVVTNITTSPGYYLLSTNAAKIGAVQVAAGGTNVILEVYDNNSTNFTFTNAAYATLISYVTNTVTTSISPLTGVTNIETNLTLFTGTITNAASSNNQLPYRSFVAAANTAPISLVNMINSRGIAFYISAPGTVLITYRPND